MPTFCDKCGNELKNDNAKFCDKCGAEVKANQNNNNTTTTVSGVVCPHCGQTTQMGIPNCQNCGAPLLEEDHLIAIIIGYAGLLLSLLIGFTWIISLIVGIYLLTRQNSKKARTHGIIITAISAVIVLLSVIIVLFAILGSAYYY